MSDFQTTENDFLSTITEIIEVNISNDQFGVSELANEIGMSRSNLLRKIKNLAGISVSQFIRQVRLVNAMELLKQNSFTVSEVSYQVGFSSTSYFSKCFHDHFGYPPGEVGKQIDKEDESNSVNQTKKKKPVLLLSIIGLLVITAIILFFVLKPNSSKSEALEKSIAVLPFINDSNDSTNVHIINGLMESILNNLQKIEDLRVISRTSVEKYRNSPKLIPEIARELNVNYFVEGSGQKIGDKILLNIQLIEAKTDKHLWAKQYNKESIDIFQLQMDVAKNIAKQVEAIITPEEEELIDKPPTDNLIAYEYFLKGMNQMNKESKEGLQEAIPLMEKAIEQDDSFASAYAAIAISYYYLDIFKADKEYSDLINNYADKALLYDSKLALSLLAKALFYLQDFEYELAVSYLEKALKYNPNSAFVINMLSDFYTNRIPNTEKYLEYSLKGIGLDIASKDSSSISYVYLHVSNAFAQTGFIDEAKTYINKSLDYNPDNLYSEYVKAYILYAQNRDLNQTKELLIDALQKDTTRLDIIQELANTCYNLRDFEDAYKYYKKFIYIEETYNLDLFRHKDGQIALVMAEMGFMDESEHYFRKFKEYAENDNSIYKHIQLAFYYSYYGETDKAIEHFELFSQEENFHYWVILFLEDDPFMDNIKNEVRFKKILKRLKSKFWKNHNKIRFSLEQEGLI